ncbi:hypothetical protein SAMN02745194_04163 [Roseomonas rosea]|uniref:Uncharacterized protein n=1 Tax=Muricoccus roseus TaxID=198092 RepID=A0A1M6PNL5_9PROT|nr:hypothetical protein [Roseomonas rosea]SHK09497.1 hypothetical protein SAMN02745194_04163 [Roseomonas rosea]
MSKAPAGKAGATPRKPAPARAQPRAQAQASAQSSGRGKGGAGSRAAAGAARAAGWRARLLGGTSWTGVAVIVLTLLVILPIAAAVLGDIWAVIIGALVGGFALGRATA